MTPPPSPPPSFLGPRTPTGARLSSLGNGNKKGVERGLCNIQLLLRASLMHLCCHRWGASSSNASPNTQPIPLIPGSREPRCMAGSAFTILLTSDGLAAAACSCSSAPALCSCMFASTRRFFFETVSSSACVSFLSSRWISDSSISLHCQRGWRDTGGGRGEAGRRTHNLHSAETSQTQNL